MQNVGRRPYTSEEMLLFPVSMRADNPAPDSPEGIESSSRQSPQAG
jgi:hypothetical protein